MVGIHRAVDHTVVAAGSLVVVVDSLVVDHRAVVVDSFVGVVVDHMVVDCSQNTSKEHTNMPCKPSIDDGLTAEKSKNDALKHQCHSVLLRNGIEQRCIEAAYFSYTLPDAAGGRARPITPANTIRVTT